MLLTATVLAVGCTNLYPELHTESPYDGLTREVSVSLTYPEGFAGYLREGVNVMIEESSRGNRYTASTNAEGVACFEIISGIYRVIVSDRVTVGADDYVLNGSVDQWRVVSTDNLAASVALRASKPGKLVFKEIYCGGCTRFPEAGNYQYDKYVIVYNNSHETLYLDNYCFGTVSPYNSTANNVWITLDSVTGETIYRDYLPIIQCVWQFPGNGSDFPLEPFEQAVVALFGAIDHQAKFPESVNLNRSDYFVCYDNVYFTNTDYHPTPGNLISSERYMKVIVKTGKANAYTFSNSSPTAILFSVPSTEGSAREYVNLDDNQVTVPGGSEKCVKIPLEWVEDAVEVFDGSSSNNAKRLSPDVDAGYVTLSKTTLHHTLYRNVDFAATAAIQGNTIVYDYSLGDDPNKIDAEATIASGGKIYYADTNNSSEDFHERSLQSLHTNAE